MTIPDSFNFPRNIPCGLGHSLQKRQIGVDKIAQIVEFLAQFLALRVVTPEIFFRRSKCRLNFAKKLGFAGIELFDTRQLALPDGGNLVPE